MLLQTTAGEIHTWLLVALAVAAGIGALIAAVRVLRGRPPRTDRIALTAAAPGRDASGQDDDEERDDDE
ncbi:hypothetical protein [Granulicoccus sp. GXG6511]|uniref:hypothetical protein n=1 Tax=Granulicoccus sp. GXG6511 TaxID=3381351 RepID=UPI003D7DDC8A